MSNLPSGYSEPESLDEHLARHYKIIDDQQAEITQLRQRVKELEAGQGEGVPFGIIDPDYGRIFTMARLLAWQEGYSICAQGSFTRDLDLLAVPWTEHARKDIEILVKRIAQAAGLTMQGEPSNKPHGRKAWTLLFPDFGDPRFVDLSVFPSATSAPRIPEGWQLVPKDIHPLNSTGCDAIIELLKNPPNCPPDVDDSNTYYDYWWSKLLRAAPNLPKQ